MIKTPMFCAIANELTRVRVGNISWNSDGNTAL